MERRRLESAGADYPYLKGLFGIPLGFLPIVSALGNWQLGPLQHTWVFLATLAVIGIACFPINRYYNEHWGRVSISARRQRRALLAMAISFPLVFAGSFLLRSHAEWSLDWPVNPTAALFALSMFIGYGATVGLRVHHIVICGSLLLAGMLPVWHGADPSNVGLVLAGVAVMACGIFDHRLLVRTFGTANVRNLENSNARA
jgi:hypothetical protein